MKKIKFFLFAVLVLLSLTSCDNKNNQSGNNMPDTEEPGDNNNTPTPENPGDNNDTPDTPENPGDDTPDTPVVPEVPKIQINYKDKPTIYLAGDSTVKTYNDDQYIGGWGQYLDLFLNENVNVVNCAQGGRSSRSFINEGRLYDIEGCDYSFSQNEGKSIGSVIEEGDFLFIQFGHNDDASKSSQYATMFDRMVPLGDKDANGVYPVTAGERTTTSVLPSEYTGLASDSEESKALQEIAKYGSLYYAYGSGTYKWYLKQYIDFARSKKAIPVLVTPVARVKFSGDTIIGGPGLHGDNFAYVEAVRQLAAEEDCLLIDLFADSKNILEAATSVYANYMMALKPNELVGTWPSGYDKTYGETSLGYTGIEATHYNKYGAFLQAAKVCEAILAETDKANGNSEYYNFVSNVLKTPEKFIDPSNLMSKTAVSAVEKLFTTITVTNPNRIYPSPSIVIEKIQGIVSLGDVTNDNYLDFKALCEQARAAYVGLNVDDRPSVTNYSKLEEYEAKVEEFIIANTPKPTNVVIFDPSTWTVQAYDSSVTKDGFTIVATSDKKVEVKKNAYNFTYSGNDYSTSNYVSLGGSASFGTTRYVEFATTGACKITVVAKSSGSSDRTLNMVDTSKNIVTTFAAKTSHTITTADISAAGTYRIGSASSGIYIYYIIIEYFE